MLAAAAYHDPLGRSGSHGLDLITLIRQLHEALGPQCIASS